MTLRFYFDECADEDVAQAIRSLGIDVLTATMAGRKGFSDQAQLEFTRQEKRVIYTTDEDFLRIGADYQRRGEFFSGIIYHRPNTRSKRQIIDSLVLCNGVFEPGEMNNQIEFI